MNDIKMSECFSGSVIKVGNGISDDHGIIVLEGYKWAVLAAIKAINNHDPMALRIKELEAALSDVLVEYQGLGGCEVLINQCNTALKESE